MKTSKSDLIARYELAERSEQLSSIALSAVLNGETSPVFRKGDYKLMIAQHDWAHGGLCILTFCPKSQRASHSVHLWETWWNETSNNQLASFANTEAFTVREIGFIAHKWMAEQRRIAACADREEGCSY